MTNLIQEKTASWNKYLFDVLGSLKEKGRYSQFEKLEGSSEKIRRHYVEDLNAFGARIRNIIDPYAKQQLLEWRPVTKTIREYGLGEYTVPVWHVLLPNTGCITLEPGSCLRHQFEHKDTFMKIGRDECGSVKVYDEYEKLALFVREYKREWTSQNDEHGCRQTARTQSTHWSFRAIHSGGTRKFEAEFLEFLGYYLNKRILRLADLRDDFPELPGT